MALDPQAKLILEQMKVAGAPKMHTLTPEEARQALTIGPLAGEPEEVGKIENKKIPGLAGEISIRIYTPLGQGPFPVLVYYHGGGWVIGDLNTVEVPCRLLTNKAQCVVVSVDYRLAPEHKFPAATEDAYIAAKWVVENSKSLQVDPTRVAVCGDSAGGNLAAVVALMARDRNGPSLLYQVLVYPVTHHAYDTDSYRENSEGYFLTKDSMIWFWNHYLQAAQDGENPYASPMLAENLSRLPPALVITAEYDPLRDEGEAYAARLMEAKVPVEITRYNGMIHGFFWMPHALEQGRKAIEQVANALKQVFNQESSN